MIDNSIFRDKKAAYYTLGCKLNFAESSSIGVQLRERGVRRVRPGEDADICIVNTCSVTELAHKKCRQTIRGIRRRHPRAFVVVVGCYAQLKPDEVAAIEGVDLIIGAEHKMDLLKYIDSLSKNSGDASIVTTSLKDIRTFSPSCSSDDRTRHFLKVQDGCDYFCTFCTIPHARGRSRNGSIASLVEQAQSVAQMGGKEIVLTGVNIGDFGRSTGESFIDLIRELDGVEGIDRYRISSVEPNLVSDEVIEFVAHSSRFTPHFHIPLQSGSDAVLKLMRRRYSTNLYRRRVDKIKTLMPNAFIGVDIIVGTRGETDELFDEARRFVESLDVSQLHVFSYSERPGTAALRLEHVVDPKVKHQRSQTLLDISDDKLQQFYETHIGKSAKVLFEHSAKADYMYGFTENYIKVEVPFDATLNNVVKEVVLGGWNEAHNALRIEHTPLA